MKSAFLMRDVVRALKVALFFAYQLPLLVHAALRSPSALGSFPFQLRHLEALFALLQESMTWHSVGVRENGDGL
jgi:hypothetical protein